MERAGHGGEPVRFRCPHCGEVLDEQQAGATCQNGHHFDRAREGYLNLLPAGRNRPRAAGDSLEMVAARRAVFDAGHYAPVMAAVAAMAAGAGRILDAGCGEGSYLAALPATERVGVDVSKPAIRLAARRWKECRFAVASTYNLPFDDATFDAVVSVFAPRPFSELHRVLHRGGWSVVVSPGRDHLAGLTEVIYGSARLHEAKPHAASPGEGTLAAADRQRVRYDLHLDGPAATQLLQMTPYWWRADSVQRARVAACERVDTVVDVWVSRHDAGA